MRQLTFLLVGLFASACQREPLPFGRTCEYLARPSDYDGLQLQLAGTVYRTRDGGYEFQPRSCESERHYHLTWSHGVRWPEGIVDEGEGHAFLPTGPRWVTGILRRRGDAGWMIEASAYERQPYKL
mgnify:FL=1